MKKDILFVINPVSGGKSKKKIEEIIKRDIDREQYNPVFIYTKAALHAIEIAQDACTKMDIIVAVGGDGLINEVAHGMIGSTIPLGIIPCGSGNGFARHFNIPLDPAKAVQTLNQCVTQVIDTIAINDKKFVNVAGVGFDAQVAHLFANSTKRGFLSYASIIMKKFANYAPENYQLILDDKEVTINHSFLVSFANCSQFGNNAYISPQAKADDGILEVCVLKKFPVYGVLKLAYQLMNRKINHSKHYQCYRAKHVVVKNSNLIEMHIDGDPVIFNDDVSIVVNPKSLTVIRGY